MSKELLTQLHVAEADSAELEQVLLNFYGQSSQVSGREVRYGADSENPRLVVTYTNAGAISDIEPGPAFAAADATSLRERIAADLLATGPVNIGRCVLFTSLPTVGWYRFQDWFQLLPVPLEAPRPDHVVGDHPLMMEVSYPSSPNASVNMFRRRKREREAELVCSALLNPRVVAGSHYVDFHWVYEPIIDGQMESTYRQGGYAWRGASFQSNAFSTIDDIPPLEAVEPQAYYTRIGIGAGDVFAVPATLTESLERFLRLGTAERARFLSASYWFQHSSKVWLTSRSASVLALVSAIEALMPPAPAAARCDKCGSPQGPGPTARFEEFVDQFVPAAESSPSRKRFYSLRSAISHGGKLLHTDQLLWGVGTESAKEGTEMRQLSELVRLALINWLLSS